MKWKTLPLFLLSVPLCAFDHWDIKTELVYMRRSKGSNHSIANDINKSQACVTGCPDFSVLNTHTLVKGFHYEPGYRASIAYSPENRNTFEATYLWVEEWEDKKDRHRNGTLFFPFETDQDDEIASLANNTDYTNADKAFAKYVSNFWTAELNYWRHFSPRNANYFSLAGLIGLRYFHINEEFRLIYVNGTDRSHYRIDTKNRVNTFQLGLDLQIQPTKRMSWDIFAKVGAFANWAKILAFLGDQNDTVKLRHYTKDKWKPGIMTDVGAQLGYQIFHFFEIHGGYELIFLNGVALAPGQIDDHDPFVSEQHKKYSARNHLMVHGFYVGIDWKF